MHNDAVYTFLKENAVYNPTQNLGISGLDNRPALQSLLSVKYFYDPSHAARYGMAQTEEFESLYENENYVPFGFLYTDTLSKAQYDSLDPLLRQYAMLSAMVVEGTGTAESASAGALETLSVTGTQQSELILTKKKSIQFSVSGCKGKEIYLRLYGASVPDQTTEFSVSGNGKTRSYRYAPKGDLMYSEQRDPCIQLGVAGNDELEIELTLLRGREISFDSLEVCSYDISDYEASVAALQQGAAPCGRFLRRKRTSRQHLFANGRLGISLFALRQGVERDGGRRRRRIDPRKFGIYGGPRRGRDSFDRTFIRDALAQTRVPAVPGRRLGYSRCPRAAGCFSYCVPEERKILKRKKTLRKKRGRAKACPRF